MSDQCGLRRADAATGQTTNIDGTWCRYLSVAGQYLYAEPDDGVIYRCDLAAGNAKAGIGLVPRAGTIAADAEDVWTIDNSGKVYQTHVATGTTVAITVSLTLNKPATAMLSVGRFLYAAVGQGNTLWRISKDTGASLVIPTTSTDPAAAGFSTIAGIASDGGRLFVADYGPTSSNLKAITPTTPAPVATPASGPEVDLGLVTTITPGGVLAGEPYTGWGIGGVAVIGDAAFVADDTRIIRTNSTSGGMSVLAGERGSTSCQDGTIGSAARFTPEYTGIRLAGTDGRFLYVTDRCGLRRVNPANGETVTIDNTWYRYATVAGHHLYAENDWGTIYHYDLATGDARAGIGSVPKAGAIAADDDAVWIISGYGNILYRINLATGATTTVTDELPERASTMLSVGDYLYAALNSHTAGYGYNNLVRITKQTGQYQTVAGGSTYGSTDGGWMAARPIRRHRRHRLHRHRPHHQRPIH